MPEDLQPTRILRRDPVGMIGLRGDLGSAELGRAVEQAAGCAVPEVRRIVTAGDRAAAWMSPDELLLFLPLMGVREALAAMARALEGRHHLALDLSDARVLFRIDGPGARDVLAKGAPVDLDPAAFGPGDLRRTRIGQVAAAFWMSEPEAFDVMCFRSVAGFMQDWLMLAARPEAQPGYYASLPA